MNARDELLHVHDAVLVVPRRLDEGVQRLDVVGGLVGEDEDRLFDVGEVLVEGRRRGADLAGDVDDPQAERAPLFEQLGGGVEQTATRLVGARADDPAVGGECRLGQARIWLGHGLGHWPSTLAESRSF